jgi:hypothetical protein
MREALRLAAVKAGEVMLFVVLLAAALWTVMALARMTWLWGWFESADDGPAAVATLITAAVLLVSVAFIHDRILRRVGVRPPEAVAVTPRKALRGMIVQTGEFLLLLALMVPWAIFWGVLFIVSGLRAKMYGADEIWIWVMTGAALILVCVPAFVTYEMISRKLRERNLPRQPGAYDRRLTGFLTFCAVISPTCEWRCPAPRPRGRWHRSPSLPCWHGPSTCTACSRAAGPWGNGAARPGYRRRSSPRGCVGNRQRLVKPSVPEQTVPWPPSRGDGGRFSSWSLPASSTAS